jgi:parallel beta-helix repeat protein
MLKLWSILCVILVIWLLPVEGARTYIVDDDGFANYKTIGEAVVAASSGDTIYIKPGTYGEEVILNKTLAIMPLTGESGPIILRGDGKETGIKITADGCSLEGLTMQNFTGPAISVTSQGNIIQDNSFEASNPAILITESERNSITKNVIKDCTAGVVLWYGSANNTVDGNEVEGGSMSILLRDAGQNQITGNSIRNGEIGIHLMNSSAIVLGGNKVDGGTFGIRVYNSSPVQIYDNQVSRSTYELYLMDSSAVEAQNCFFRDGTFGVVLENCTQSVVRGSTSENNVRAFGLGESSGNAIVENNILDSNDSALELIYSPGNNLASNKIAGSPKGIIMVDSSRNVLENNSLQDVDWALYVEGSNQEGFDNSISKSNVVDGKPIAYYYGQSGKVIEGEELAHLTLAYCNGFTVTDNFITNDAIFLFGSHDNQILENNVSSCYGMRLLDSKGNVITQNVLNSNRYSGIFLVNSESNEISGNTARGNNQMGISLFNSSQNTLSGNTFDHNFETGIWFNISHDNQVLLNNISNNPVGMLVLNSAENQVYHNNFLDNKIQAEDREGSNSWDMGNVTGGNYWSDHMAKGNPSQGWPKIVRGGKIDNFPFQDLNGWLL